MQRHNKTIMIVDGKLGGRDIVGFQTGDQGVVMAFLGCAVSKSSNRQLPRLSFACWLYGNLCFSC